MHLVSYMRFFRLLKTDGQNHVHDGVNVFTGKCIYRSQIRKKPNVFSWNILHTTHTYHAIPMEFALSRVSASGFHGNPFKRR